MFNDWLLKQLKEKNWAQADLARASGLTTAAISKYINGRIPDDASLRKIAKALKISAEAVFRAAGVLPPVTDNPRAEKIAHRFNLLDDMRKGIAEHLLDGLIDQQEKEQIELSKGRETKKQS